MLLQSSDRNNPHPCAAPILNTKMTEPSKVLHIRNVGPEISEVSIFSGKLYSVESAMSVPIID